MRKLILILWMFIVAPLLAQSNPAIYGNAWQANALANLEIGLHKTADYRWTAEQTSTVPSTDFFFKSGGGYGSGTGGTIRISFQTDDGTANHFPSGTELASYSFAPGNTVRAWIQHAVWSVSASTTSGTIYHYVFTNTDANPTVNYVSIDDLDNTNLTAAPYYAGTAQTNCSTAPCFLNFSELWQDVGPPWLLKANHIPVFSTNYANGVHQGNSYTDALAGSQLFNVQGANQAGQLFNPTSSFSVGSVNIWVQKVGSPAAALTVALQTAAGAAIDSASIPAASIGASFSYVKGTFASSRTLAASSSYRVTASCATCNASNYYRVFPMQNGQSIGMPATTSQFTTGNYQTNTGSGWANVGGHADYAMNLFLVGQQPRGYLTTPAELTSIANKAAAGTQPYTDAVLSVKNYANTGSIAVSSSTKNATYWPWGSTPYSTACPGGSADIPAWLGTSNGGGGGRSTFAKVLVWRLTGDTDYADDAITRLRNAYNSSATSSDWGGEVYSGGNQCILNLAHYIPDYVMAADLLEDYPGWTTTDKTNMVNWVAGVIYKRISWGDAQSINNWGSSASAAAAAISDYVFPSGHTLVNWTGTTITSTTAWNSAKQHWIDRANGNNYMTQFSPGCPLVGGIYQGIRADGGIPEELNRGSPGCNGLYLAGPYPTCGGSDANYSWVTLGSYTQQAELFLRRGDSSLYDHIQPDNSGSVQRGFLFSLANPNLLSNSCDGPGGGMFTRSGLEYAYRYYRNSTFYKELTTTGSSPAANGNGSRFVGAVNVRQSPFGTLLAGFNVAENPGLPPAISPPSSNQVYVSQSGGTVNCAPDGLAAQTTISVVSYNASGSTYGPGSLVGLCGTITSQIAVPTSGSSATPITLRFETGASVRISPGANSNGAVGLGGQSWIVVDGGLNQPCGWNTATNLSEGTCNGQIENMLYGSPGATCPGGPCTTQPAATGCPGNVLIQGSGSNVEIRNLDVGPSYIHTATSNDGKGTPGICKLNGGTNWNIHDNKLHDGSWHTTIASGSAITISGNELYNNGHNVAGDCSGNCNGVTFSGNYCHDMQNWDTSGDFWHNNCIHMYTNTSGQSMTNITINNNIMKGNMGGNPTGQIFFETNGGSLTNFAVFNNVLGNTNSSSNGRLLDLSNCTSNCWVYNNTQIGPSNSWGWCNEIGYSGSPAISITAMENNANSTCGYLNDSQTNVTYGVLDYNGYGSFSQGWKWGSITINVFNTWKSNSGEGAHSFQNNSLNINTSTYQPNAGSPVIGAGVNVCVANPTFCTSFPAIKNDIAGNARPVSTAWDIGAYMFGSSPPPPLTPSSPSNFVIASVK